MPNSQFITGSPLLSAIKGFDRPEDLYGVEVNGHLEFFGYQEAAERYCDDKGLFIFQAKPLREVLASTMEEEQV